MHPYTLWKIRVQNDHVNGCGGDGGRRGWPHLLYVSSGILRDRGRQWQIT
jgi:hypothetical protein